MSWWEVSFPVTGFSGFYVTGPLSTPLPVVLVNFTGSRQGTGVLLNWQVGVESGLLRYEVEGSVDGVAFSTLGNVLADGSSSYQYFVAAPSAGLHFYRLKMVNTDGSSSYSSVAVVDLSAAAGSAGVQVLSNPFTSFCVIRVVSGMAGPAQLRLTDISGKILWRSQVALVAGVNTYTLPSAATLAKGIYLLSVSGGQMMETVKVVKE
jgi:hypothetical protein